MAEEKIGRRRSEERERERAEGVKGEARKASSSRRVLLI